MKRTSSGFGLITFTASGIFGLSIAFSGEPAAQPAPFSDSLKVSIADGQVVYGPETLDQAEEIGGTLFLVAHVLPENIFYLEGDGITSDIVSFKGFDVRFFSDTETIFPVIPTPPPQGQMIIKINNEGADFDDAFASDPSTLSGLPPSCTSGSDVLAAFLNLTTFVDCFPIAEPPDPTKQEPVTVNTTQLVIQMLEPDGTNSDLVIVDPITYTITSDANSGSPLPAPGLGDLVINGESSGVLSVTAISDVPEPTSFALLASRLILTGVVGGRRAG